MDIFFYDDDCACGHDLQNHAETGTAPCEHTGCTCIAYAQRSTGATSPRSYEQIKEQRDTAIRYLKALLTTSSLHPDYYRRVHIAAEQWLKNLGDLDDIIS